MTANENMNYFFAYLKFPGALLLGNSVGPFLVLISEPKWHHFGKGNKFFNLCL